MKTTQILSSSTAQRLTSMLVAGDLLPGQRLKEVELSKRLKISRTPLREALISLEKLGIVDSAPNVGFRVRELSMSEAEELYPLIGLLEAHALKLAFPLVRTQADALEEANRSFLKKKKSPNDAVVLDQEFHLKLISLCRNGVLLSMIEELRLRISRYEYRYMTKNSRIEQSAAQHDEIVAAIRSNNDSAACAALKKNWNSGMLEIVAELAKAESGVA